jgi:signal transduction histidine kinase
MDLKGITVHNNTGDLLVYADSLFKNVFFNLIDNAVRHGETIAEIRFFTEPQERGYAIVMEDNGIGIPADEKEKIFLKGFGKNTGHGLFLSREILGITGITIREAGESGRGARFEILVPEGAFRPTAS